MPTNHTPGPPTPNAPTPRSSTPGSGDAPALHLYVLLDRSGSMATMADDVIGGFNRLLADQQADGPDARMTLVQFDSEDAQEVLADALPITEMVAIDRSTFVPRGATPLLDATGVLLGRAASRASVLASVGQPTEEVVVVSITDGQENASREFSLGTVRRLIDDRTREGWTFVFLGAALDVYGEAGGLGYGPGNTQSFASSSDGAVAAFSSLSQATSNMRSKVRRSERFDKGDFFKEGKPAEEHRRRSGR